MSDHEQIVVANQCGKCDKVFKDGDVGYLIKMIRVVVKGSRVLENDVWVLRCEEHA